VPDYRLLFYYLMEKFEAFDVTSKFDSRTNSFVSVLEVDEKCSVLCV
jgi:hypothetical protein